MLRKTLTSLVGVSAFVVAIHWPEAIFLVMAGLLVFWFDQVRRANGLTWGEMAQRHD